MKNYIDKLEWKTIFLLGLLVAGILGYFAINKSDELNRLKKQHQKMINDVREDKEAEIDQIIKERDSLINTLKVEVNELQERTIALNQRIRNYDKTPTIDIDFISAFNVIAKSNYGPGSRRSDFGQSENN